MLWSEKVKLIVAGFSLGKGGHERSAILRNEQCSQSNNIKILGADIGHPSREVEVWWGLGSLWLFRFWCWSSLSDSSCRDCCPSASPDFIQSPQVKSIIGVIVAKKGEFGVVLFLFSDSVLEYHPISRNVAGGFLDNRSDVFRRKDYTRRWFADFIEGS